MSNFAQATGPFAGTQSATVERGAYELEQLRAGNRRFVCGHSTVASDPEARAALVHSQRPMAAVLACADSRVPVEYVFDQGFGNLFVVRVAGNIAAPAGIGSIEYAVGVCSTTLVVVLGHTGCGAVAAALHEIVTGTRADSPNLRAITSNVREAMEPLVSGDGVADLDATMPLAVCANVRATVTKLQRMSPLLQQAVMSRRLSIVGAVYALETGVVEFL